MVQVAAVQTGLRGPIVASEQTDEFTRDGAGRWLLARSDVRQLYEGAGLPHADSSRARHRSPRGQPADFAARRPRPTRSAAVMLRDTPEGYRYLEREAPAPRRRPAVGDRRRRLAGSRWPDLAARPDARARRHRRSEHLAPLPFAGLSYVDFNLFGTGTQFNGFFGGTYGQLAFSVPSLGGTAGSSPGRAFGIASSYNDRAFVDGREQYDENIRQRPAQASVWAAASADAARLTLRAGYDLGLHSVSRGGRRPRPAFVVPADQVAHGAARSALDGAARRLERHRSGGTARAAERLARLGTARRRATIGDPAHTRLPALRRVVARSVDALAARGRRGSRRRGWAGTISTGSAATRSARSTTACAAIRRR